LMWAITHAWQLYVYTSLVSLFIFFSMDYCSCFCCRISHDEKKWKEEEGCLCPNEVLKVSARMTADLFIGDVVKIVLLMIRRINGPLSDCVDVFKLLWPFLWISINSVFLSPYLFFPLRGKGSLSELVDVNETQHKYRLV
jgi:hypothetical protein